MTIKEFLVKFRVQADTKAVDEVTKKVSTLRNLFVGFIGLRLGQRLLEGIQHTAELGQEMTVLAKAAGLGAVEYQRLAYAAEQNGITQQRLGISLTRLNKQMVSAKNGTKSAVEIFSRAGISRDQIKSFHTTTDALYALQDAFGNMKGPDAQAKKLHVIAELFGRGAHNFLLFMDQGASVTRKLEADAERVAAVMSENTVKEMTLLERSFLGVGRSLRAFFATMLAGISPLLRAGIYRLQRVLGANKQRLEQNMQGFAMAIVKVAGFAYGFVLGLVQKISRLLPDAGNVFNNFAKGIIAAFQDVLASNGFAYIVQGIKDIWHSMSGKHFDASLLLQGIKELGEGLVTSLGNLLIGVLKVVASSVGEILNKAWDGIVAWLKETSPQTYEFFKRNFSNILELVTNFKGVLKSVFDDVFSWSQQLMSWWTDKLGAVGKLLNLTNTRFSDAPFFAPSGAPAQEKGTQLSVAGAMAPVASPFVSHDESMMAMRSMLNNLSAEPATAALRALSNAQMTPTTRLPVPDQRLMLNPTDRLGMPQGTRLTVPITINAPNSDPHAIARIAKEQLNDLFGEHMKQAHQKTSPQVAK